MERILEPSRQEPYPDRIIDEIGGGFGLGAVCGSAWHFLKGAYKSPRGERLLGGFQAAGMNAPRLGGSVAVLGGLISVLDCSMVYIRQKEDPWNSIIAWIEAIGFLDMRQGFRPAARSAASWGGLAALFGGADIMLNKMVSSVPQNRPMKKPIPNYVAACGPGFPMGRQPSPVSTTLPADLTGDSSSNSSWFGVFSGIGDKKKETSSGTEVAVRHRFWRPLTDAPAR